MLPLEVVYLEDWIVVLSLVTIFEQQLANELLLKTFTSCYSDKRYDEQEYSEYCYPKKTGYDAG
jgi:hypothetical protein